jgi:hypothetical protein
LQVFILIYVSPLRENKRIISEGLPTKQKSQFVTRHSEKLTPFLLSRYPQKHVINSE